MHAAACCPAPFVAQDALDVGAAPERHRGRQLYPSAVIDQRAATLEARVDNLERDVQRLATLLRDVIERLETHVGADLNRDGRWGDGSTGVTP